jgi:hypothetical protein
MAWVFPLWPGGQAFALRQAQGGSAVLVALSEADEWAALAGRRA